MNWQPIDIIVTILTATICLILVVVITGAVIRGEPMTPEGIKLTDKLTMGVVSIISFYVGNQTKKI